MMKRLRVFTVLVAAACAQTPPGPPTPHSAMEVAASFGRTWDASIDQLAHRTLPIKTIERASGLIATDLLSLDSTFYSVADCGKDGDGGAFVPSNATFNVLVRGVQPVLRSALPGGGCLSAIPGTA
jgi:hypothetical protein